MILRDYQSTAVEFLVPRMRGCVVAPAGSGKTIIAAHAIHERTYAPLGRPWRLGWFANTREQVEQGHKALASLDWGDRQVVADIECVAAMPDIEKYDIIVIDEGHHIPAETWYRLTGNERANVWGFTATPWHEDPERNETMVEVFKEFHTIEREDVLESGHLAPAIVTMHDVDLEDEFADDIEMRTHLETERRCARFRFIPRETHEKRARWQITQEVVQGNDRRNARVVDIALVQKIPAGHSVLILVGSIEHGNHLASRIPGAMVVHSKLAKKTRSGAIALFRDGTLKCMVATSLADEGLDVPRASCLILAAGGRAAGKIEQRTGRVLRPFAGKDAGEIHDFIDRGAPLAYAQALARMRTYRKLGYEINK